MATPRPISSNSDEERLLKDYNPSSLSYNLQVTKSKRWSPKLRTIHSLGLIITTLLLTISTTLLIILLTRQKTFHKPHIVGQNDTETFSAWKDCGSSSSSARSKGCIFDLMLTSWVHPDCSDPELMENYLSAHNYSWFSDKALTQPLSSEYMRKGTYVEMYTDNYYHFAHCGYAWEMQMRKWRSGRPIDSVLWGYHHTVHCATALVNHVQPHNITTLSLGFDSCGTP
ncbi:hypothetical protein HYALB_00003135 [Hymenoscyphus albidus]|uniref:Uncharacterized protein n=1 Tax=Hymenoscyphus albidus TaxID=595503 RepID=A0A9N9LFH2_9HELO|nr:hypothetical protein HYALB_00003135 [Hymenoscyphus albidus]